MVDTNNAKYFAILDRIQEAKQTGDTSIRVKASELNIEAMKDLKKSGFNIRKDVSIYDNEFYIIEV